MAVAFAACKKSGSTTIVPVDAGLKSQFNFKPGSYWVYRDSVSGETDSAYVTGSTENYYSEGCVLRANMPKYENLSVLLQVQHSSSSDTERWTFTMKQNKFYLGLYSNTDRVESALFFNLFTWPLAIGNVSYSGCVRYPDSGGVDVLIPEVSLGGQSYMNAARSSHSPLYNDQSQQYADYFYVNPDAGLIKVVFTHPADSVHRVLELQRYHIVR